MVDQLNADHSARFTKLCQLSRVLICRRASQAEEMLARGFTRLIHNSAHSLMKALQEKEAEVAELQGTVERSTSERAALEGELASLRLDKQHSDGALDELSRALASSKDLRGRVEDLELQLSESVPRTDFLELQSKLTTYENSSRLHAEKLEVKEKTEQGLKEINAKLEDEVKECNALIADLRAVSVYHQERFEDLQRKASTPPVNRRYEHEAMQKLVEELKGAKQALAKITAERDAEIEAVKNRLEAEYRVVIKAMTASRNRMEAKLEARARRSPAPGLESPLMDASELEVSTEGILVAKMPLPEQPETTDGVEFYVERTADAIYKQLQLLNGCSSGLTRVCVRRFAKKAELIASPLMMAKLDLLMDKGKKGTKSKVVSFELFLSILNLLALGLIRKGKLCKAHFASPYPGLNALITERGIAYSPLKHFHERSTLSVASPSLDNNAESPINGQYRHDTRTDGVELGSSDDQLLCKVWRREEGPLRAIFDYYAETFRSSKFEQSKLDGTQIYSLESSMDVNAFCRLCLDFDIIPSLLNRARLSRLFHEENYSVQGKSGEARISYASWLHLLQKIACLKFSSSDGYASVDLKLQGLLQWMDGSGGKAKMRRARSSAMVRKFKAAA